MKSFVKLCVLTGLLLPVVSNSAEMPELAQKHNCVACHAIDSKIIGPSFVSVAKKYKSQTVFVYSGKEYPLREGLKHKVGKGGAGNWGYTPMPANAAAGVSEEDIASLLDFILGLDA